MQTFIMLIQLELNDGLGSRTLRLNAITTFDTYRLTLSNIDVTTT